MEQLAEGTEAPLADGSPPGPLSIPSLRVFSSPCRSQQSIPNLISLLSPQGSLGKPVIITWGPKGGSPPWTSHAKTQDAWGPLLFPLLHRANECDLWG